METLDLQLTFESGSCESLNFVMGANTSKSKQTKVKKQSEKLSKSKKRKRNSDRKQNVKEITEHETQDGNDLSLNSQFDSRLKKQAEKLEKFNRKKNTSVDRKINCNVDVLEDVFEDGSDITVDSESVIKDGKDLTVDLEMVSENIMHEENNVSENSGLYSVRSVSQEVADA